MGTKLTVRDKEFVNALRNATGEGIARATIYAHTQAKKLVNVPNTGVSKPGRDSKGRFTSGKRKYPNPSKPGEPPRKITGFGQKNIILQIDRKEMAGRYGISKNAKYMFWLEVGTKFIAPRPWMLKTITKNVSKIVAFLKIAGRKIK